MPLLTRYESNGATCDKGKCDRTISWEWTPCRQDDDQPIRDAVKAAGWAMFRSGFRRWFYCPDHLDAGSRSKDRIV